MIPELGRSPGEGNGNPLQYYCLENPMDRGAWWAAGHGVTKSRTRLSDFTYLVVAHGLSCPSARGVFLDQGSSSCPLPWQVEALPLDHQGSPRLFINVAEMGWHLELGVLQVAWACVFTNLCTRGVNPEEPRPSILGSRSVLSRRFLETGIPALSPSSCVTSRSLCLRLLICN